MARKRQLTSEEVARVGDEIYERAIRDKIEPQHRGRIVAIDVNSEDYEVGDTASAAAQAARTHKRPIPKPRYRPAIYMT